MIEFAGLCLAVNAAVVAAAAAMISMAGARIARHADVIGVRTGRARDSVGCDECND